MANIGKLITGAQDAWATLMTTELNSLASGSSVLGATAVTNGSNLDLWVEFGFTTGGSITPTGVPFLGLYLCPLNPDGSTYGDGRFGSAAAGNPGTNYYIGFAGVVAAAGTQVGTFSIPMSAAKFQMPMPRGSWKPVVYNNSGVGLSSSGNTLSWRSTNLNFNGT